MTSPGSPFIEDLWQMSRRACGYYAWAGQNSAYRIARHLSGRKRHPCCEDYIDGRQVVDELFEHGLGEHPLIDMAFSAFVRAEIRLSTRFIPQRSHEERLTGNLVSEIDAAIHLIKSPFANLSKERYGEAKEIDFIYFDLSRGGTIEKYTGADLGIILHIDLPDRPKLTRFAALQAKKMDSSAELDKAQFGVLSKSFQDAGAYLFYDMDVSRLAPPMVVSCDTFDQDCAKDPNTKSVSVSASRVFEHVPLSLWLFRFVARSKAGGSSSSFHQALNLFLHRDIVGFDSGRLAILTIGKPLNLTVNDNGLGIGVEE